MVRKVNAGRGTACRRNSTENSPQLNTAATMIRSPGWASRLVSTERSPRAITVTMPVIARAIPKAWIGRVRSPSRIHASSATKMGMVALIRAMLVAVVVVAARYNRVLNAPTLKVARASMEPKRWRITSRWRHIPGSPKGSRIARAITQRQNDMESGGMLSTVPRATTALPAQNRGVRTRPM